MEFGNSKAEMQDTSLRLSSVPGGHLGLGTRLHNYGQQYTNVDDRQTPPAAPWNVNYMHVYTCMYRQT